MHAAQRHWALTSECCLHLAPIKQIQGSDLSQCFTFIKLRISKMAFQHAKRIRGTVKMLDIWQAAKVHGYDGVEFSATQQPSLHTAHPA